MLDEEKLRKIHNIISNRIDEKIEYSILRDDSFSFTTSNLEDVIREENLKWARINEIKINVKNNDEKFELSLNFDDRGANLFINGENRDDVFLLFSELKEYLLNEISIKKWTLQLFKEIFRVLPSVANTFVQHTPQK